MRINDQLAALGISGPQIHHNVGVAKLYEMGLKEDGTRLSGSGALLAYSGEKTGRSPNDKRVVEEADSKDNIWWGKVNAPISAESFTTNKKLATDHLSENTYLYVIDGYIGWDPDWRIKARIICSRAYHALFMYNMMIRPTAEELETFGEPDWVVINAGTRPADTSVEGVDSTTSVALDFKQQQFVILGTEYAGEMKKGLFTVMNYLMPLRGELPMHCSANESADGDSALFFGLSGTGKTTLSADPERPLIGDDEHGWCKNGIFNFEGGCYAKAIDISIEREPLLWEAIRYGAVLENVVIDEATLVVDYEDDSITENTRCSYPVEFIENAKIPCVGGHPKHVVFLTCDAFGVLPPIAKLTPEQAMYHFISGYTAKVAGTEAGVTEPTATFSACFGAPFLVWHPMKYAELLREKLADFGATAWLVNTGWAEGPAGQTPRIPLSYNRDSISAALSGALDSVEYSQDEIFRLQVPTTCPGIPDKAMNPADMWSDSTAYAAQAQKLAGLFINNFANYADMATQEVLAAGPRATASA
jgi:phosphoenolpyruvate carboxykinase (ATP)